ncbi:MAG: hypothetical protein V3W18_02950 [candidate division Zixibacteria bacterium]
MSGNSHNPNPGYETRDVNAFKVSIFVILGIIVLVSILLALDVYFTYSAEQEIYKMVLKPESKALLDIQKRDKETLSSYGIVNSDSGIYQIPIDSAMQAILVEKGLSRGEK